ncbi:MAG: hypothetical protein J5472_05595 [Clostridia bacterium]|nr:hypothetical protein [Clostridia bacterium]
MKQEHGFDPDLRPAFPDMPEDCRDALLRAARSVREERKMKKFTLRTALIAALLIVATMTAALAATDALGWTDFFSVYDGIPVPKAAQEILNATEEQTYQAGPLTFTVKQLLSDGRLAMSAVDIRTADGSAALYCMDPSDTLGCNGENGKDMARRLGLPEETTYTEAAKQLKLPLYRASASLEAPEPYSGGEGMEDPLWNADNTMTYFSMAYLNRESMAGTDKMPAQLFLFVSRIDPETGEDIADSMIRQREPMEIPVHGVIAEKDYAPAESFTLNGYALLSVHAEQTVCGLYLDRVYEADEEARKLYESADAEKTWEIIDPLWEGEWLRENGEAFPTGMSLSGEIDDKSFPLIHCRDMISAEEMPETLILVTDEKQITLK